MNSQTENWWIYARWRSGMDIILACFHVPDLLGKWLQVVFHVSIHRRIYGYFLVKRPTKKAIAAMDEWMLMSAMPLVHWIVAVDFPLNNSYVFQYSRVISIWIDCDFPPLKSTVERRFQALLVPGGAGEISWSPCEVRGSIQGPGIRSPGMWHYMFFFWGGGIPKRSWVSISKMIGFWSTPPF